MIVVPESTINRLWCWGGAELMQPGRVLGLAAGVAAGRARADRVRAGQDAGRTRDLRDQTPYLALPNATEKAQVLI